MSENGVTAEVIETDAPPPTVRLTPEVAAFLAEVVNTIQLPASAPNFAEQAALIVAAKTQLEGALK